MYVASTFKNFGKEKGLDDYVLTAAGSFGAVFNGTSRIFWATYQDKIGFKKIYISMLCIQMVTSFSFYFSAEEKTGTTYAIIVCLSFFTLGGHFSVFPAVSATTYGPTSGGKIYSLIFSSIALSALAGFFMQQYTLDTIHYEGLYLIAAFFTLSSLILVIFYKDEPYYMEKDTSETI